MPGFHVSAPATLAMCASCKAEIKPGSLRLGRTAFSSTSSTYKHFGTCISDATWSSISQHLDVPEELTSLVGYAELNEKQQAKANAAFQRYLDNVAKKKEEEEEAAAASADEAMEDKPKRPATSFMLWRNVMLKTGKAGGDTAKQLGEKWRALTEDEKRPWQVIFEDAKVEFAKEIAAWQERNPDHEAKEQKVKAAKKAKKATASAQKKKRKTDSDIDSDDESETELDKAMQEDVDAGMDEFDAPQPPKQKKAKRSPAAAAAGTEKENEGAGGAKKSKKKKDKNPTTPKTKGGGGGLKLSASVSKDPWVGVGANGEYDDVVIETQVGVDY